MKRTALFWILAFLITVASAIYQRMTGPTYPVTGTQLVGPKAVAYRLLRSHETSSDAPVEVRTGDPSISGVLEWKRLKTADPWTTVPMVFANGSLTAFLPRQPEAGKLEYRVTLTDGNARAVVPEAGEVVLRFKGDVPTPVLIVHVLLMFGAMMLSTRTGLEYFNPAPNFGRLIPWTIGLLAVGGLILGPIVQKYAFDAYWTGWPFGHDLTDNKTFLAILGWLAVVWAWRTGRNAKAWALGAAILVLAVFMIPHSMLGSELDYSQEPAQTRTR